MKKIVITALLVTMSFVSCMGCGNGKEFRKNSKKEETVQSKEVFQEKDTYLESKLDSPKDVEEIKKLVSVEDQIYLITSKDETDTLWKNVDNKWEKLWNASEQYSKFSQQKGKHIFCSVAKDGTVALVKINGTNINVVLTDMNGKKIEEKIIEIPGSFYDESTDSFRYEQLDKESAVIANDTKVGICKLQNGEVHVLKEHGDNAYALKGDKQDVYIVTENGVKMYDLNGEKEKEAPNWLVNEVGIPQVSRIDAIKKGDKSRIYQVDENGIYEINEKKKTSYVGKVQTIAGDLDGMVKQFAATSQEFFLVYDDGDKQSVYKYTKTKKKIQPLKIYSLEENEELFKIARDYQKINQDVNVQIEIGMESGIERTDAISKLNTKIVTGEGPDILLLDGMNIENYTEKGLLLDLSDVVEQEKNQCFTNILKTYKQDKKITAVPGRFGLIVATAKDSVETDADKMEKMFEQYQKQTPEVPACSPYSYQTIVREMADIALIDGGSDEKKLQKYYDEIKQLHELLDMKEVDKQEEKMPSKNLTRTGIGDYEMVASESAECSMDYITAVMEVYSLMQFQNAGVLQYGYVEKDGGKVYIPEMVLGVNAKSNQQKLAKELVSFMLSDEEQKKAMNWGIPVNKSALEEKLKQYKDDVYVTAVPEEENAVGSSKKIKTKAVTEKEIQEVKEQFETLEKSVSQDMIALENVLKEADQIITEKETVMEAAKKYRDVF